jgi:hypothetical protein
VRKCRCGPLQPLDVAEVLRATGRALFAEDTPAEPERTGTALHPAPCTLHVHLHCKCLAQLSYRYRVPNGAAVARSVMPSISTPT